MIIDKFKQKQAAQQILQNSQFQSDDTLIDIKNNGD